MPEDEDITPQEDEAAQVFSQLIDPAKLAPASSLASQPTEKQSQDAYTWQKARRRKDREGFFSTPVRGFGPEGEHVLWLPSANLSSKWQVENGQPKLVQTTSCFDDPRLAKVRDEALESFRPTGIATILRSGPAFMRFVIMLIQSNYCDPSGGPLSDDDFNFLLSGSDRWHNDAVKILLGGDDVVDRLCKLGMVAELAPAAIPPVQEVLASAPAPLPGQPGLLKKRKRKWGLLHYFRK